MGKTHKDKHTPQRILDLAHHNCFFPNIVRACQTRSSKGRLLTSASPADSTALLTSQLRALGLYTADTLGDGNCLFRALSNQLTGSPTLPQRICDHIEHKEREQVTYGGHMGLSTFAHVERRDVKVVQPGSVYVIEWRAFAESPEPPAKSYQYHKYEEDEDEEDYYGHQHIKDKDPPEGDTMYVAYHDWEHFSIWNLLRPHTGLPCVRETPPHPVASTSSSPAPNGKPVRKEVTLRSGSGASNTPTPSPAPDLTSRFPRAAPRPLLPPYLPPHYPPHPLRTPYLPNDAPPSPLHPASPKRALDTADDSEASSSGLRKQRQSTQTAKRAPRTLTTLLRIRVRVWVPRRLYPALIRIRRIPSISAPAPAPSTCAGEREANDEETEEGAVAADIARRGPRGEG
ncbi:hypothetical protein DXG01_015521 [Tephrocybe rancida]|nr:hypothetical protein DXG01_015521 [Tephrocybe rancida]